MPISVRDLLGWARDAADIYRTINPPGTGGGGGFTVPIGLPGGGTGTGMSPVPGVPMAAYLAMYSAISAQGGVPQWGTGGGTPGLVKMPNGQCLQITTTGLKPATCPGGGGPNTGGGEPWNPGGGDFGGGGAGGSFGPDLPVPVPPVQGGGTCAPMPYGMGGVSIVESPTYVGRVQPRPGYVTVTLPFAVAGYSCGARVQMLKEVAQKFGLWKRKPRPVLTHADMKCLRKAERVENKLKTLTTRHTDFKVVKKGR